MPARPSISTRQIRQEPNASSDSVALVVAMREDEVIVVVVEALNRNGLARAEHAHALRLWLRLLACSKQIETEIRTRLRERFSGCLCLACLRALAAGAPLDGDAAPR